eukprot:Awhi_evm1s15579
MNIAMASIDLEEISVKANNEFLSFSPKSTSDDVVIEAMGTVSYAFGNSIFNNLPVQNLTTNMVGLIGVFPLQYVT